MREWNVVATVRDKAYLEGRKVLGEVAPVARTEYFNVLVMKVADVRTFAEKLALMWEANPRLKTLLGRVVPLDRVFDFQTPAEFEARVKEEMVCWIPRLSGARFYVRMHRRGFKDRLSSQGEEQLLDRWIQQSLIERGRNAGVDFDDPDWIIDLETVSQRAGISLWSRADLARYPFLHLD